MMNKKLQITKEKMFNIILFNKTLNKKNFYYQKIMNKRMKKLKKIKNLLLKHIANQMKSKII